MRSLPRLVAGLLAATSALHGAAAVRRVTVASAPVERAAQVITISLPPALAAGATLRNAGGEVVPLQVEADLTARFIVARQAAGQTLAFTLEAGRLPDQGNVQVVEEPSPPKPGNTASIETATSTSLIRGKTGRLRVSVGGRAILYYQMDRDAGRREDIDPKWQPAGYLHPVLTPSGFSITEGYSAADPLLALYGPAHAGISTRGPLTTRETFRGFDYSRTGEVEAPLEFVGIDTTWSGPVHGGFTSWQRWLEDKGPGSTVLVNESWELTAYAVPKAVGDVHVFDLVVTQANATTKPLNFPGPQSLVVQAATASRMADTAETAPGGRFSGENISDKKVRWIVLSGEGKDRPAGFALLLPAPGAEEAGFSLAPSVPSLFTGAGTALAPGGRTALRQRVVVFDGPPDRTLLEALWNGYTVGFNVTLSAP